jgi:hypothetical protein
MITVDETTDPKSRTYPQTRDDKVRGIPAVWVGTFLIVATVAFSAAALLVADHSHWAAPVFVVAAFSLVFAVVPFVVVTEKRARREIDRDCELECKEWETALSDVEPEAVKQLAILNFKQLRRYIKISQIQARRSFAASVAAAIVGLLVLISGTAATLAASTTSSKVVGGILTSAGLALSSYITRTFVKNYQMASRQMSYYYGQPLVHCYLLQADWLANEIQRRFGTENGLAAWRKAQDGALSAAVESQNNLLSLDEHWMSRVGRDKKPAARSAGSPLFKRRHADELAVARTQLNATSLTRRHP